MKDTFQLHDPDSARMEVAVAALSDGPGFAYEDVWFHRDGGVLRCDAISWRAHAADKAEAVSLIARARDVLADLTEAYPMLSDALVGLTPHFSVVDDYGNGWLPIAEM